MGGNFTYSKMSVTAITVILARWHTLTMKLFAVKIQIKTAET